MLRTPSINKRMPLDTSSITINSNSTRLHETKSGTLGGGGGKLIARVVELWNLRDVIVALLRCNFSPFLSKFRRCTLDRNDSISLMIFCSNVLRSSGTHFVPHLRSRWLRLPLFFCIYALWGFHVSLSRQWCRGHEGREVHLITTRYTPTWDFQ